MTPFLAKPPITATIARGVPAATPQAPATTITDMVEMRFRVTRKVITAKMIVNSTSQAASLSDILWMGAFLLSASSTSLMIWPKTVSFPTFSVRISNNYSFTGLNSFYSGLDLFPVPPYKGASRNRLFQFDDCRPSLVDRVSLYEL